ncbi:hypothetical protein [Streptomyces sp. st115]|nr:hypothetical protein [Streptomyces sp. st115]
MADAPVRCAGPMPVSVPTPMPIAGIGADADTEGAYVPYGPGDFGQ